MFLDLEDGTQLRSNCPYEEQEPQKSSLDRDTKIDIVGITVKATKMTRLPSILSIGEREVLESGAEEPVMTEGGRANLPNIQAT